MRRKTPRESFTARGSPSLRSNDRHWKARCSGQRFYDVCVLWSLAEEGGKGQRTMNAAVFIRSQRKECGVTQIQNETNRQSDGRTVSTRAGNLRKTGVCVRACVYVFACMCACLTALHIDREWEKWRLERSKKIEKRRPKQTTKKEPCMHTNILTKRSEVCNWIILHGPS